MIWPSSGDDDESSKKEPFDPPKSEDYSVPMSDDVGTGRKRRLDSVFPELIKRAVEFGVKNASEAPENLKHFVGDLKLPKEIASYLFAQIDDTKNGLFRVVAKEMRDFLEHTNLAGEMQKMLTTVQFEISTTIRFRPNDGKPPANDEPASESDVNAAAKQNSGPEVKTQVHVKKYERRGAKKSRE
jgi:hypothetical protein